MRIIPCNNADKNPSATATPPCSLQFLRRCPAAAEGPPCKRLPFAAQKATFYKTIGILLRRKRMPIGNAVAKLLPYKLNFNNLQSHYRIYFFLNSFNITLFAPFKKFCL